MITTPQPIYNCKFKIIIVGNAYVGKKSLIYRYVSGMWHSEAIHHTIGVDFVICCCLFIIEHQILTTQWDCYKASDMECSSRWTIFTISPKLL